MNNNKSFIDEILGKDHHMDMNNYLTLQYNDYFPESETKIKNLGEKFAAINSYFLEYVKGYHIPAAFVKSTDKNSLLFINHHKFPFYIKILNTVDKRTAKIFGVKEEKALNIPIFEIHYGSGRDSIITESHLQVFELCTIDEIRLIYRICSKINVVIKSFFERRNFILAEMCCYFGKSEEKIYLIDGFTPNSLKIIPVDGNSKSVNPYKLVSSTEMKNYTGQILELLNT